MSEKPTILAIETATRSCSVALLHNGIVCSHSQTGNNIHSEVVLNMIQKILEEGGAKRTQIDAIAVDQGPGSFTGLRIGIGVAQGIAFALNCPMIAVTSLDVLANQFVASCPPDKVMNLIAGLDARMSEIYWQTYEVTCGGFKATVTPQVTRPKDIQTKMNGEISAVGNAWGVYRELLCDSVIRNLQIEDSIIEPDAKHLLQLAETQYHAKKYVDASELKPLYVRDSVAKKSSKPLL